MVRLLLYTDRLVTNWIKIFKYEPWETILGQRKEKQDITNSMNKRTKA